MPFIYWYLGADLLVRAPDCSSGGQRFETDLPPSRDSFESLFFFEINQPHSPKKANKCINDLHLKLQKIAWLWHVFYSVFKSNFI